MNEQNNHSILYPLNQLGCIALDGMQSVKFLQGQITINAEQIQAGQLNQGAICNHQGRLIALFWATKIEQRILLIQPRNSIAATIEHLAKYAVFSKTDISDQSDNYSLYANELNSVLTGGSSPLNRVENAVLLSDKDNVVNFFLIEKTSQSEDEPAVNSFESQNPSINFQSEHDYFYQLAQQGIPWLNDTTQTHFLPHGLNLPGLGAVDFKKGCFTGQEVIARMHYKGKLKSHMQLFVSEEKLNIQPSDKISCDEKSAGDIICWSENQNSQTALLVLLKDKYLQHKTFHLNDEKGPILKLIDKPSPE